MEQFEERDGAAVAGASVCEHSVLYILDFANQPMRLGRCLFCEIDALKVRLCDDCGEAIHGGRWCGCADLGRPHNWRELPIE